MVRFLLLSILLYGCTINTPLLDNSNVKFSPSVPEDVQFYITNSLIKNNESKVSFSAYSVNEYKILAGSSIRPLENEIKISLTSEIIVNYISFDVSHQIKKIYNSNELNPLAENQRKEFIIKQSLEEIIQKINMEISKIEMQSIKS